MWARDTETKRQGSRRRSIPNARFGPEVGAATLRAIAVDTDHSYRLARRVGAVRLAGRAGRGAAEISESRLRQRATM
jgi:hypothetical protein